VPSPRHVPGCAVKKLPTCGVAIGYADNTLLMSKNKEDAVAMDSEIAMLPDKNSPKNGFGQNFGHTQKAKTGRDFSGIAIIS
jgi:hypothetical protein